MDTNTKGQKDAATDNRAVGAVVLSYVSNQKYVITGNTERCSPEVLSSRDVLEDPKDGRGKLECVRQCTRDIRCELAVYQKFQDASATCTKMSMVLSNSSNVLDVSNSKLCTAVNIHPCLNQGKLYEGICLCQDGFTGPACEYRNPSCCSTRWTEITRLVSEENTVYVNSRLVNNFSRATPKLVFRNNVLHVRSVMNAMDSGGVISTDNWYILSFLFLEKAAWNRFAEKPRRQFLNILKSGDYQILSLNATSQKYNLDNYHVDFLFVAPDEIRLMVERQMPNDWALLADDLSNGFELEDFTWTNVDAKEQSVGAQLADRMLPIVRGHLVDPPVMRNLQFVLGVQSFSVDFPMYGGHAGDISVDNVKNIVYVNPCWTRVNGGTHSRPSLLTGWKTLGTYLRLGKDVRINIGTTYHQVLEVIQIGDNFTVLMAPFLSQNVTPGSTPTLYGVRSAITSSSMYESCTHEIEGQGVIERAKYPTPYNVALFVDSRNWKKVYSVFSNSSIAYGSVSKLITSVLAGSDTRIWIEWLKSGVSRFLRTHMSSVTDDGKVSTESLVTWRTNIDSEVTLSSACDLQYILVTSEGRVEILSFNVLTPGKSEVQHDVIITWFLA